MLEDEEARLRRVLQDSRNRTQRARIRLMSVVFTVGFTLGGLSVAGVNYVDQLQTERDAALQQAGLLDEGPARNKRGFDIYETIDTHSF